MGEVEDEPFADSPELPTLLLSQITKKVCCIRRWGDELFGDYIFF